MLNPLPQETPWFHRETKHRPIDTLIFGTLDTAVTTTPTVVSCFPWITVITTTPSLTVVVVVLFVGLGGLGRRAILGRGGIVEKRGCPTPTFRENPAV
jgi:hypothetical protein